MHQDRVGSARAASLCAGAAGAQTLQGRVVELGAQEPVAGALIALVDPTGGEVARGATSPSGGFVLAAGQIRPLSHPDPADRPAALAIDAVRAGCGSDLPRHLPGGGAPLPAAHADCRSEPLAVRRASRGVGCPGRAARRRGCCSSPARQGRPRASDASPSLPPRTSRCSIPTLRALDSASTGVTRLARWPIESADPDSLRAWGFVR